MHKGAAPPISHPTCLRLGYAAHSQVDPAQGEANLEQNNCEHAHEQAKPDDHIARHADDVLASGLGVNVGAAGGQAEWCERVMGGVGTSRARRQAGC